MMDCGGGFLGFYLKICVEIEVSISLVRGEAWLGVGGMWVGSRLGVGWVRCGDMVEIAAKIQKIIRVDFNGLVGGIM